MLALPPTQRQSLTGRASFTIFHRSLHSRHPSTEGTLTWTAARLRSLQVRTSSSVVLSSSFCSESALLAFLTSTYRQRYTHFFLNPRFILAYALGLMVDFFLLRLIPSFFLLLMFAYNPFGISISSLIPPSSGLIYCELL